MALVTGAGRRVGRIIALRLAAAGYAVASHYRSSGREAVDLVREIRMRGGRAEAFQADLTQVSEIRRLTRSVEKRLGPVRLLVNSASVFFPRPFSSVSERDWDRTIDANLKSVFFLSQEVSRRMIRRAAAGVIINIEDAAVRRPYRNHAPYLVSKAGVAMLTRVLAMELGPRVRVCGVAPGPVLLPEGYSAAARRKAVHHTLLKRGGSPEDVAAAVLFLADRAPYTTGTTVFVDGGRSAA
ncbi:SDR family oxidoreductase [bacterium]|nr:SDR family oxidoreductase [bacterium]